MKKISIAFLIIVLVLSLSACGGKTVSIDIDKLASDLLSADLFVDQLNSSKEINFDVAGQVGVEISLCKNYCYYIGSSVTGEEFGLFECNSEKDAKTVKAQLEARQETLIKLYQSYSPEAVERVNASILKAEGNYVIFVSADRPEQAESIINSAIKG